MQRRDSAPRIVLKSGRVQPIWQGHPWVFTGAVDRVEGHPAPGDCVTVVDPKGQPLGWGVFHPRSQIQVRMISSVHEGVAADLSSETGVAALLQQRIAQAAAIRQRLGLPSDQTTAFRLVHAEGDRLPGLTVDWYQGVAVVQFTTLGMKRRQAAIVDALRQLPSPWALDAIVETVVPRFAQMEGFEATPGVLYARSGFQLGSGLLGLESGISFWISPLEGQKTGLFVDQRDNRLQFAQAVQGLHVLDVCSYTGGFALQALRRGARSAVCVDASEKALSQLAENAARNQLPAVQCVQSDAFDFLSALPPQSQEAIVLDPPKFAYAAKDVNTALSAYRRWNAAAFRAARPGAVVATCSCSQRVDVPSFQRMLAAAAVDAKRQVRLLSMGRQAPDHPILPAFPEGDYLKFALLYVE